MKGSAQRIALVFNPRSGKWLNPSFENEIHQHLSALQTELVWLPFDPQQLPQLKKQLEHAAPLKALWIAGGDGTVLSLAPIAQALQLPLGILPAGTMNLMARDLGMSLDIAEASAQLLKAHNCEIDLAEVNGQPFLCISNLGVSTRYTRVREELRERPAWQRTPQLFYQSLKLLWKYPRLRLRLVANGQSIRVKTRSVSITNNPLNTSGDYFLCRQSLDSGTLGVYLTHESTSWSLPRLFLRMWWQSDWKHDPDISVLSSDRLTIHVQRKRKLWVMNDGELIRLKTPLHYRIHTRSLKVLSPVERT